MVHDPFGHQTGMRVENVKVRGGDFTPARRAAVRKGLHTLHTLEIMAVNIYKCQITARPCAAQHQRPAAIVQRDDPHAGFPDEAVRAWLKPSKLRWSFWLVGYVFGLGLALCSVAGACSGRAPGWNARAFMTYGELLASVEWERRHARCHREGSGRRGRPCGALGVLLAHPEAVC